MLKRYQKILSCYFIVFILLLSDSLQLCYAQQDPNAWKWKSDMSLVAKRTISACDVSTTLIKQYYYFANLAYRATRNLNEEVIKKKNLDESMPQFGVATRHFRESLKHYQDALDLFAKAKKMYQKAKRTASRSYDKDLKKFKTNTAYTLKAANKTYQNAKRTVIMGNRKFNRGNRLFNEGVDLFQRATGKKLQKRTKFHKWPAT